MSSMIRISYFLSIAALVSVIFSTVVSVTISLISTVMCLIAISTNRGKHLIIALVLSLIVLAFVSLMVFISISGYSLLE